MRKIPSISERTKELLFNWITGKTPPLKETHPRLHKMLKVFSSLFMIFFIALATVIIIIAISLNQIASVERPIMERMIEDYQAYIEFDTLPMYQAGFDQFSDMVINGDYGDSAIGWTLLAGETFASGHGDVEGQEAVIRMGLRRLHGWNLEFFIRIYDDKMPFLVSQDESNANKYPNFDFNEAESNAIASCLDSSPEIKKSPFAIFYYGLNMINSRLIYPDCHLDQVIRLNSEPTTKYPHL
jgi:hypothetical protein